MHAAESCLLQQSPGVQSGPDGVLRRHELFGMTPSSEAEASESRFGPQVIGNELVQALTSQFYERLERYSLQLNSYVSIQTARIPRGQAG